MPSRLRASCQVWKSPQVGGRQRSLGTSCRTKTCRSSTDRRVHRFSGCIHRASSLIVPSLPPPSSNGSSVHPAVRSHRGRKEVAKRQRKRAEERKARLSCRCSVAEGREREEGYNRLISPRCLSAQRKCGRNKRPERGRGWHRFRAGDISSSLQAPLIAFASVHEILPGARC